VTHFWDEDEGDRRMEEGARIGDNHKKVLRKA
jgi:hypothetical protein